MIMFGMNRITQRISARAAAVAMTSALACMPALIGCNSGGGGGSRGGGGGQAAESTSRYDGLPDKADNPALGAFAVNTRWQKQDLTYFIANSSLSISDSEAAQIISDAFAAWAAVVPLNFSEVNSADDADFVIGFGSAAHCELYQAAGVQCPSQDGQGAGFDGAGNILAHCYFPPGAGGSSAGDCHYDDDETWASDLSTDPNSVRFLETTIHELGHGLGLEHSDDPNAIMFPSYDPSIVKVTLSPDDIAGVQSLYGARDGSTEPDQAPIPEPVDPNDVPNDGGGGTPGDADGDELADEVELFIVGTDPNNPDTDGDGLIDLEVIFGLNPLNPDTDGDGVSDGDELANGTDPLTPDFGGGGAGELVGCYSGSDSEGSALEFQVFEDGSVSGTLSVLQFGFPTQIGLFGGADAAGNILLLSYDYFFSFSGSISNGAGSGGVETAGGFVGQWQAGAANCQGGDGGVNTNGIDSNGFNTDGFDSNGIDSNGIDSNGVDSNGVDTDGLGTNGFKVRAKSQDGATGRAKMDVYQPTRGNRKKLSHGSLQKVQWEAGHQH